MHQLQTPTRFRRLVSTLLSLAMLASFVPSFAPAVAAAAPLPFVFDPAAAETSWVSSNVTLTLNAVETSTTQVHYVFSGATTRNATESVTSTSVVVTAEGTTTVSFDGYDVTPTLTESHGPAYVRIDRSRPNTSTLSVNGVVALAPSVATSVTPSSVRITSTDAVSGIKKVYYQIGGGAVASSTVSPVDLPAITATGTTAYQFRAEDNAGNLEETTRTVSVIIDKAAPTTTSNRVATYINSATISFTATDTGGAGVKTTYYQLDGGSVKTGTSVTTTATTPIPHTLKFWSEDNAGNVENSAAASNNVTFTVTADTSAPITTLVTKPGLDLTAWQSTTTTFSLTATDTPAGATSGVAGTFYRLNAGSTVAYTPGTVVSVSAEGSTLLEYWSVDNGGAKEATNTATFKIDKTDPSSTNNRVAEYDGASSITIVATDPLSGIQAIEYGIDGGSSAMLSGIASGATTVTASLPAVSVAGTHTIQYVVSDRAGNRDDTETVTFHVTRQPAFTLVSKVVFMSNTRNPAGVSITTFLRDGATPLGVRRVVLEYSTSSTFATKGSVVATTNTSGWVRFNRNITTRTYFRIRFAGDADYKPALSAKVAYVPKVALTTPAAGTRQRAGRAFTVSGKIYPAHRAGTGIKIQRYQLIRRRWVSRGYIWVRVTARNRYLYSGRMALSRGTWRIRAVAPYDIAHNTTASGFRTIVVR